MLAGFGFIIRYSHRAFFAVWLCFLANGASSALVLFFLFRPKIWPIYIGLFCLGAALIHVAHPPAMDILEDWRGQLKTSLYQYLDDNEAGTMSAIVLGDRGHIPKEINMVFRHTGTGHILVIAGLHMAMMTAMIIFHFKVDKDSPLLANGGQYFAFIYLCDFDRRFNPGDACGVYGFGHLGRACR